MYYYLVHVLCRFAVYLASQFVHGSYRYNINFSKKVEKISRLYGCLPLISEDF